MLYLVPTPVGNLEDITLRALRVLKEADLILAEDTRTSGLLLKHFDIHRPMLSYHKFNEHQTVSRIVERLLAGETVAVVSDAGTPCIADPGFMLRDNDLIRADAAHDPAIHVTGTFGNHGLHTELLAQHGCHDAGFQIAGHCKDDDVDVCNAELLQRVALML